MRTEWKIFAPIAAFFFIVTVIYGYFTRLTEPIGMVGLLLSGLFCVMIAVYLALTSRKIDRPEDRPDGEIAEGAGELGFFPASSIWPLWAALTLVLIALGPVFGWWISLIGVGMGIWSLTGWVYEYYRGDYRH
ncbi:MAG: cytochrome c oxidase subunit 4 [Propionibacteriaceae bacterium]